MKAYREIAILALALLLTREGAATPPPTEGRPARKRSATVTCAFSNRHYSGWCWVTEAVPEGTKAESVCQNVLGCLNDVRCTKSYCNATSIRGGWKLEQVQTKSHTQSRPNPK